MLFWLFPSAFATTLTVGSAGTYATIQEAVAVAVDGDRIEVAAGSYAGPVDLGGRNLEIVGVDGAAVTTLTGGGAHVLIAATDEIATLQGFTIANPGASGLLIGGNLTVRDVVLDGLGTSASVGGAVQVLRGSASFFDVAFSNNMADVGAHIHVGDGTVSLEGCTLDTSTVRSGALYVSGTSAATLTRSSLSLNVATGTGGAIHVEDGGVLTLLEVEGDENQATHGGVVHAGVGALLTVYGGRYRDNRATVDGGVFGLAGAQATLTDVTLSENRADTYGGAVAVWDGGFLSDTDGTWSDNSSVSAGGALDLRGTSSATLQGSAFYDNQALTGYGGAVYATEAEFTASDCEFLRSGSYYGGGAMYLTLLTGPVVLERCTLSNNTATFGEGGAISLYNRSDLVLSDSTFEDNDGGYYGGAISSRTYGDLQITRSVFRSNIAGERGSSGAGGAVYHLPYNNLGDRILVSDSLFEDNTANGEGGGLISWYTDLVELKDNRFINNEAGEDHAGGAVVVKRTSVATVQRNLMANNRAAMGGGAYVDTTVLVDGLHLWTNNVIQENRADYGGGLCFVDMDNPGFLQVHNNDLLGNAAAIDAGGLCLFTSGIDFRNNVIAYQSEAGGLTPFDEVSVEGSTFAFNNVYDNLDGEVGGVLNELPADNLSVEPMFANYSRDGNAFNDQYSLAAASGLIDAGDPTILDPDGGPSDIGSRGGPHASMEDADADGVPARLDCDDEDASAYPGATEVWYDGVNQDCNPGSDYDADGDGHDQMPQGDDCDDTDPAVWECEVDDTDVDTDNPVDTDVQEPEPTPAATPEDPEEPSGCGCDGSGQAPWFLALCSVAALRRRTR